MDIVVLGIDLGKNSLSLTGLDASGPSCFAAPDAAELGGELCRRSWALHRGDRGVLRGASSGSGVYRPGHEVAGICAPLREAQKNDDLDAEAIAEVATRPAMRFVVVKSQAQSDIQALHQARERLVETTARG